MNLYVHFPFCRAKCAYCALHSRAGSTSSARAEHVARIARELAQRKLSPLDTVYFGGGSPALCDLSPLAPKLAKDAEFTVELHPLDATPAKLDELRRLGAQVQVDGKVAVIEGVDHFIGAPVQACDLRAGAAMVIAGLAAQGTTEISQVQYIERGYEDLVGKLCHLGADIRVAEDAAQDLEEQHIG